MESRVPAELLELLSALAMTSPSFLVELLLEPLVLSVELLQFVADMEEEILFGFGCGEEEEEAGEG